MNQHPGNNSAYPIEAMNFLSELCYSNKAIMKANILTITVFGNVYLEW